MILFTIIIAVLLVSLISFVGALGLIVTQAKLQKFLTIFVSFAAGSMLAVALLDLIPESVADSSAPRAMAFVLIGVVLFFVVERFFCWYHCHSGTCSGHSGKDRRSIGYLSLIGDGMHNFLDGAAIAAAFMASPMTGWVATLAAALHEVPQEFGDFSILLYSGFSKTKALIYNFASGLTAIIGAFLAYLFSSWFTGLQPAILAVGAGGFLYIALADLLPEVHSADNKHGGAKNLLWFILGIALISILVRGV